MYLFYGKIFIVRSVSAIESRVSIPSRAMKCSFHIQHQVQHDKFYQGLGALFTLHIMLMNFHYIDKKKLFPIKIHVPFLTNFSCFLSPKIYILQELNDCG